jgi:hypothetical protein
VYGIKSAVRRLDFAPDIKDMQVIDVKKGRFVFRPRPGKPVSLADLQKSVTKAGYQIERARISVRGTLAPDGKLRVPETGQVFLLVGQRKPGESSGSSVTAAGAWEARQGEQEILLDEQGPGEGGS